MTTSQTSDNATDLLYLALAEPIGLLLSTNDPERARQRLYTARRATGDPALAVLQFKMSPWPGQGQLVICKAEVTVANTAEDFGL